MPGRSGLVVAPGVPAHLLFDFDLSASNEVNVAVAPPIVTVDPTFIADVTVRQPKEHRVRGSLGAVDLETGSFVMALRPFFLRRGEFGNLYVATTTRTVFEIDGETEQGDAGLALLARLPAATPVIARGDVTVSPFRFFAREVYAGLSVPLGSYDALTGHVAARTGDTLTVIGATIERKDGTVVFNDALTLLVGGDTLVTRQAAHEEGLGASAISVGQHIAAFGTLSSQAPGGLRLDASCACS
jgi:hypothetical protein